MGKVSPPTRSTQEFWFRASVGVLVGILILTAPLYSAGLLRVILIVMYLIVLFLVRTGRIRPRRR